MWWPSAGAGFTHTFEQLLTRSAGKIVDIFGTVILEDLGGCVHNTSHFKFRARKCGKRVFFGKLLNQHFAPETNKAGNSGK